MAPAILEVYGNRHAGKYSVSELLARAAKMNAERMWCGDSCVHASEHEGVFVFGPSADVQLPWLFC